MSRLSQILLVAVCAGAAGWLVAGAQEQGESDRGRAGNGEPPAAAANADAAQPDPLDRAAFHELRRAARAEIERQLQKRITFKFKDEVLTDVLAELGRAGGFPVRVDSRALADEGIAEDESITIEFQDIPIEQALNRVLEPLDLTSRIDDEVLQITTRVTAEEWLSTAVYDIQRLLKLKPLRDGHEHEDDDELEDVAFRQFGGEPPREPRSKAVWLLDAVQEFTSGPWEDIDGTGGTVDLVRHLLVVRQTQQVQTEVERLLDALERAADGKLEQRSIDVRPVSYPHAEDARIHKVLAGKISLDFRDRPLKSAFEEISNRGGITVIIDEKALADEGIASDAPVTIHVAEISWHSALRLMLEPIGLTSIVEDGVLKVTTQPAADEKLIAVVYGISDLSEARLDGPPLTEAIQNGTSGPWEDIDGTGGNIDQPVSGILLVRQTDAQHAEIAALLADLRQHAKERQAAAEPARRKPEDPAKVVTGFYAIDPLLAEFPVGNAAEQAAVGADAQRPPRSALERTILRIVAPESWKDHGTGGDGVLEKVNQLLVVRQSVRVHQELREFLDRLEFAAEQALHAQQAQIPEIGGGSFGEPGGGGLRPGGGFFRVPAR